VNRLTQLLHEFAEFLIQVTTSVSSEWAVWDRKASFPTLLMMMARGNAARRRESPRVTAANRSMERGVKAQPAAKLWACGRIALGGFWE
jgi:hypothetical protein